MLRVVISGAAGQIAYSLLPLLGLGHVFGNNQAIELRLLDIPQASGALKGVQMELQDCAFPLVTQIIATCDLRTAFQDVDIAILVGGFPRRQGMQRKDLIAKNAVIFKEQGQALNEYASKNVKVLVVANPANTNCWIAMTHAPNLCRANFTALTRLDHERLRGFLVEKWNEKQVVSDWISPTDVLNCIIWGNHSSTQVPDTSQVLVRKRNEALKALKDIFNDTEWLETTLVKRVQERGAAIIQARKASSAMSAAIAIARHLQDWLFGTKDGEFISMAICSDNNPYNLPQDLIYSFPVLCEKGGKVSIVEHLQVNQRIKSMMEISANELLQEQEDVKQILQEMNKQ